MSGKAKRQNQRDNVRALEAELAHSAIDRARVRMSGDKAPVSPDRRPLPERIAALADLVAKRVKRAEEARDKAREDVQSAAISGGDMAQRYQSAMEERNSAAFQAKKLSDELDAARVRIGELERELSRLDAARRDALAQANRQRRNAHGSHGARV